MESTPTQKKKIDGICRYLSKYLHYRANHLVRCCPKLKTAMSDVKWHTLDRMTEVLMAKKMFGTDRVMIADGITGDNETIKRGIFSPVGQYSIISDVIERKAATTEVGSGVTITNIKELYKFIDPVYENLIELIQSWFWWDLRDAVDNYLLETYLERINKLINIELTPPICDVYKKLLNKGAEEPITKNEIINYEFQKIGELFKSMQKRRMEEHSVQKILARDPFNRLEIDDYILEMGESIKRTRKLLSSNEINENDKDFYSRKMGIKPSDVSIPKALKYEENEINRLETLLSEYLETASHLGEPYNLKTKEIEEYEKKINAIAPKETVSAEAAS